MGTHSTAFVSVVTRLKRYLKSNKLRHNTCRQLTPMGVPPTFTTEASMRVCSGGNMPKQQLRPQHMQAARPKGLHPRSALKRL